MKTRAAIDIASLKNLQEQKALLTKIESLPYSEELRSVMDRSIHTCSPERTLKDAVKEMTRRNISSIIVVDDQNTAIGILTERDVMRKIAAEDDIDIGKTPVAAVMTPSPVTLEPGNTIYRALSVLSERGIKHLPLVENGALAGMITLRQLLKLKYPEPMTLIERIRNAPDTAALREIKSSLPEIAALKLSMGFPAHDIVVMISMINQDIHRKTMELSVAELGAPPLPICMYVTGSHGRRENLLSPDQDHGMVIADSDDGLKQYDEYFVRLSSMFSEGLAEIGFATCPGYIMCQNPLWRKSVSEWKLQIEYWFDRQVRELGRFVTILFDAVPVFGQRELFYEVADFAFPLLGQHHEVFRVLHEEEARHQVPTTGIFKRFITEKSGVHRGELDIKRSGLRFVVEGVRILALMHGIRETSTLKRITALVEGNFLHRDDGEYFESAYHYLLYLALKTQTEKAMARKEIDTFINPAKLSQRDRETLRHAFKAVTTLQDLVAGEFGELVI